MLYLYLYGGKKYEKTYLLTYLLLVLNANAAINWGNLWTEEEAKVFTQLKVDVYGNGGDMEMFSNWMGAEVGDAKLIYDSTGFPVLYEVEILNGSENVGTMEIWADKALGTPYCGIKLPNTNELNTKLPAKNNDKPMGEVVYYNYPKKAYKIKVEIPDKAVEKTVLFDVYSGKPVGKEMVKSFKDLIKEENITTDWKYWVELLSRHKECKMPPELEIIANSLNVTHYQQVQSTWCVGACAQMILDYHNDTVLSQYQLLNCYFIPAEETTCTGAGLDGVAYDDVVPGWNRLGYLSSTKVNSSLTIGATRAEIDAGYPFMIPYGGLHMLTAYGYITGWNVTSEVQVLDPAWPATDSYNSSHLISLPSVDITFYYTIR